jgi:hypothetical protein
MTNTTATDRAAQIARIAALPDELAAALDARTPADPWTIRQIAHHVADSHMNALIRTKLILTEQHPTLRPYDQDAWATLADAAMPLDPTLGLLRGLHERWVRLFEMMKEEDWARGGFHPENGDVTLGDILESYAQHGTDHLAQIGRIRAALGK